MKRGKRKIAAGCGGIALILIITFMPGLPWSARCHHFVSKLRAKAEMKIFGWRGVPPRLIALAGKVITRKGNLKGAEVEALDSVSGWASLTDEQGNFVLPDVMWYPRASYRVVIKANDYQVRQAKVSAPADYPEGGVLSVGDLKFDQGCEADVTNSEGKNSITWIAYDRQSHAYYKELFDRLTAGKETDEAKLDEISRYVASKLIEDKNDEETPATDSESPRQVLQNGSRYCGELALALATIAEAGNYKTRMLDLVDRTTAPSAHVVTEIYYADKWHLYDPIVGSARASYKEVRLDAGFRFPETMPEHLPKIAHRDIASLYRSGLYHYYCIKP